MDTSKKTKRKTFIGEITEEGAGDILYDFEGTYCNFKNPRNNAYNWISNTCSTPSVDTGSSAKTESRYLYVETSSPVPKEAKFQFESPYLSDGPKFLKFWYHMYGINMGTLTVLRNETQLWTRTGDQGKSWQMAEINIGTSTRPNKVTFEALKGNGWRSNPVYIGL